MMKTITEESPLVYSCSGCSSAAQMANYMAVQLDRIGLAEMSCIAGVGGNVKKLVRTALSGRKIVVIDGCPLACSKACLGNHNITPDMHFELTGFGVSKRQQEDFDMQQATTITSGGKNNTQLGFTMQVSGASADLKKAMNNGEFLLTGEVTVVTPNQGSGALQYTIKMEQLKVLSCAEAMGCNNIMSTTVSLQATRIGWTYYTQGRTGAATISRKYGWDADTNAEWTNF